MKENLTHVLTNLGLETKEAQLYVALVELGECTVLALSRKSGVNRASIYYILDKMKKRGLVSQLKRKGTDYFRPVDPVLVLDQFKDRVATFQAVVPELKALIGKTDQSSPVRYFEGVDGIKALYADSLSAKTEILNFSNPRDVVKFWPEHDEEYTKRRVKAKIHLRGIAPDDESGRKIHADDKKRDREVRLVDPKAYSFSDEILIYDGKVAMVSLKDQAFGVLIESQALADSHRSIFEMAWQFAASPQKAKVKFGEPVQRVLF